ncbi:HGxxPAAW family protein [Streptomyces sp. NPDC102359]|uniref:HGxxPAAW family protein n=1 Tax=unclassified Streptomyces TaxID=2593676 RepID=UPI003814DD14
MSAHPYDHGHTVAGWTGCGIAVTGTAVLGAGLCTGSGPLLVAGAVVVAVALLVTWGLHLAGWGKPSGPRPREQWDWRVRDTGARAGHPRCVGCRLAGRVRVAVPDAVVPEPARVAASVTEPASASVPVSASASASVPVSAGADSVGAGS